MSQKIVPSLWFHSHEETVEAVTFYVSVFPASEIIRTTHYPRGAQRPTDEVVSILFSLRGQRYVAINGGPEPGFRFTAALSLQVLCDDQQEVDHYWQRLVEGGGKHGPCGWLSDRFGLSWQVTPTALEHALEDEAIDDVDHELRDEKERRRQRVYETMTKMGKLDVAAIEQAVRGDA